MKLLGHMSGPMRWVPSALPLFASLALGCGGTGFPSDDDFSADDDAGDDDANDPDADGDGYPASTDCDDNDATLNWDDADGDGWSTCEGDCDDFDSDLSPADQDADGFSSCDGDCDDSDASTYPGAPELCDNTDNDCDGTVDEGTGTDGDGDGFTPCEGDCNDGNADVYPGAPALCDGQQDNNCDGVPDDNEIDSDGDGYTPCTSDCDDADSTVFPGAPDICDGIDDNNCDGTVDPQERDDDGDGITECDGDCDDADGTIHPGATELCDGLDNDCSGGPEVDGDGVCGIWILLGGLNQWLAMALDPNGSPHAPTFPIEAAFAVHDLDRIWVVTHSTYHVIDRVQLNWVASGNRDALFPEVSGTTITAGVCIPAYWGDGVNAWLALTATSVPWTYNLDVTTETFSFVAGDPYEPEWSAVLAPDPANLRAAWLDLYNDWGYASGSPQAICGQGGNTIGPYYAFLTSQGSIHLFEASSCNEFYDAPPANSWSIFTTPGAPDPAVVRAGAWAWDTVVLFGS